MSRPAFWDALYARGEDGWELRSPAPPLGALLEEHRLPLGRAAVLGCGRGHDARLLAAHGYAVWGFDFSPLAVAEARRLAEGGGATVEGGGPSRLRFEERDIFSLPEAYPGFFDVVWEYTCFCAIAPARRGAYADAVRAILRPGGVLAALFYPLREGKEGPPFPVGQDEIRRLFEPQFVFLETARPAQSVERRRGLEWLVLMRPRDPAPSGPRTGTVQGV